MRFTKQEINKLRLALIEEFQKEDYDMCRIFQLMESFVITNSWSEDAFYQEIIRPAYKRYFRK